MDSEKAFDVLNGMKTLPQRMVSKVINTRVFTAFLDSHPAFRVNSHALPTHENAGLLEKQHVHAWPCALFTVDMANANIDRVAFTQFFDALEPAFGHQVSIGQTNTIVLCPALTSHSELSREEQQRAGIELTTMRIAMGTDDVKNLMAHFIMSAKIHFDPVQPGFSEQFMDADDIDALYERVHQDVYSKFAGQQPKMSAYLSR